MSIAATPSYETDLNGVLHATMRFTGVSAGGWGFTVNFSPLGCGVSLQPAFFDDGSRSTPRHPDLRPLIAELDALAKIPGSDPGALRIVERFMADMPERPEDELRRECEEREAIDRSAAKGRRLIDASKTTTPPLAAIWGMLATPILRILSMDDDSLDCEIRHLADETWIQKSGDEFSTIESPSPHQMAMFGGVYVDGSD